jgi:hypothetical protein
MNRVNHQSFIIIIDMIFIIISGWRPVFLRRVVAQPLNCKFTPPGPKYEEASIILFYLCGGDRWVPPRGGSASGHQAGVAAHQREDRSCHRIARVRTHHIITLSLSSDSNCVGKKMLHSWSTNRAFRNVKLFR